MLYGQERERLGSKVPRFSERERERERERGKVWTRSGTRVKSESKKKEDFFKIN